MAQIFVSLTDVARVGNFHIFIIFLLQPKTRNMLLWKYNIIQIRYHDYSKISYNMNIIHILDTLLSSPLKQPETLQLLCWSIFQFSLPSSNSKKLKKNLFNFTNPLAIIDSGMTVETCVGPDDLVWLSSSLHDLRNM